MGLLNKAKVDSKLAEEVFNRLKARKYNRYPIEENSDLYSEVYTCMEEKLPIRLCGYWGITAKKGVDERDHEAKEVLEALRLRIEDVYEKGLSYRIFLSDSHAEMNNISREEYTPYLRQVEKFWNNMKDNIGLLSNTRMFFDDSDLFNGLEIKLSDESAKQKLVKGAQRLFRGQTEEGIGLYCCTRYAEKKIFEQLRPAIFFTYNSPDFKPLFPNMPTLYLKAGKGSHPPWVV